VLLYFGPLLCGFNAPITGLTDKICAVRNNIYDVSLGIP